MTTNSNLPTENKAFRLLERMLWESTELIGQAWSATVHNLDDKELAAFAEGVTHTLVLSLEWLQGAADSNDDPCLQACGDKWTDQLRAAVGEQLRRRHPGERCCPGRKLNEWLGTIRDWRIKLVDDADISPFDGPYNKQPSTRLDLEMERWIRRDGNCSQEEQTLFYRIKEENRALHSFYCHLTGDDEWRKKRWGRLQPEQPVSLEKWREKREAEAAITTPHSPGCRFLTIGGHDDCPRCRELDARIKAVNSAGGPSTELPI